MDDLPLPDPHVPPSTASTVHTSVVGSEDVLQSHMTAGESVTSKNKIQVCIPMKLRIMYTMQVWVTEGMSVIGVDS